jgi:pimeloyl-ACP methyl ester carboxylesterase
MALETLRSQYRRQMHSTPEIRMIPGSVRVDGRVIHFAVSDNDKTCGPDGPGSPPIWAVNIHGYFAGGAMYWRESARLAQRTGWRIVNPCLPGFGGSDPLDWDELNMSSLVRCVEAILEHLDAGPVVMIGHSMGGAVSVQYAREHFDNTLGIIYRDGVATPAWKNRRGPLPVLLAPIVPDMAAMADLMVAALFDTPDLLIGRMYSTLRSLLPDMTRNIKMVGRVLPVGSMLMTLDMTADVEALAKQELPLLAEWGCFDRVATSATASEFARAARTRIQWVPGGHSWMLARPQGQADLLSHIPSGRAFVAEVEKRWREASSDRRRLRAV